MANNYVQMPMGQFNPPPLGQWTTGLCECFSDVNSCMDIYFCYCCANARQWDAQDGRQDSLNMLILLANICFGTTFCVNCVLRCNLAQKYKLPEGSCMSCCISLWLPSCGMCQQHRELTNRGYWPGGTICSTPPAGYVPAPAPMGQNYGLGATGTGFASTNNPQMNYNGLNQSAQASLDSGVASANATLNNANRQFLGQNQPQQPYYGSGGSPQWQQNQGYQQTQQGYQQPGYQQPPPPGYPQSPPGYGQQGYQQQPGSPNNKPEPPMPQ